MRFGGTTASTAFAWSITALAILPLAYLIGHTALAPDALVTVLERSGTWRALGHSLALAVAVGVLSVALALPLAWLTHATDLPMRRTLRVLLVLPLAIPSYVGGFVIVAAFAQGGFAPVLDPYSALGAVLALSFSYPLALLTIQASLDRLDPRLWESARSLGCSPWQAFARVVLPQQKPALASGALLTGLYAIGDFGAVSLTRYESLSYLVYLRHKSLFERDEAAPLSLLLIALSGALAWAARKSGGRASTELRAQRFAWPAIALGAWRYPAWLTCMVVVLLFLVAPIAVVVGWLWRGMQLGNEAPWPWQAAGYSVALGVSAALVLVPIALTSALLARFAQRSSSIAWVAYLGYALPGIAVALALVSFATDGPWATLIYQSYPLLMGAYAIRFLSLGASTLDDALSAQSPSMYWAARSLGCSPLAATARVIMPLSWTAIIAAAIAIFIAVIKELPVTLLLAPIGVSTLAARIWSLTEDAYFAAAAPAVLLLVGLATALVLLKPDVRSNRMADGPS